MQERGYRRLAYACLGAIALGCLLGIAIPAGPGWDFANFYDTGRRVAAGQLGDIYDPSTPIAGQPATNDHLDFFGTPLSAYLYAPMGLLPPGAALVAFKLENTLALWLGLLLLFRFSRQFARPDALASGRFLALFAAAALLFQPFWTVYRVGGQTTPTALLLLILGLAAHVRGRNVWSSLCFVATVAIKPAFALGLVFLVATGGLRFAAWTAAHAAWLAAVSLLALGWPVHESFIEKMLGNAGRISHWGFNSSIWIVPRFLFEWLGERGFDAGAWPNVVNLALRGTIVGSLGFLALRSRRRDWSERARAHFSWILGLTFFLLMAQTAWEHYLGVLFLGVAHWIAHDPPDRSVRSLAVAIVALSLLQNLVVVRALQAAFPFDSLPALAGILALKSAPLWLFWWLLWHHRDAWEATYREPAWQ